MAESVTLARVLLIAPGVGAIATVAVSWCLAAMVAIPGSPLGLQAAGFDVGSASVALAAPVAEVVDHLQVVTAVRRGTVAAAVYPVVHGTNYGSVDELLGSTPLLRRVKVGPDGLAQDASSCFVYRGDGWPFVAMCWTADGAWPELTVQGGFPLQADSPGVMTSNGFDDRQVLPLTPLWPGFIANTLFFAAVWSALWSIPRVTLAARRRWRIRSGRCLACGQMSHPTQARCPECGEVRRQPSESLLPRLACAEA